MESSGSKLLESIPSQTSKCTNISTIWKKPAGQLLSDTDICIKSTYSRVFKGFIEQLDKDIQARFPDVTYLNNVRPLSRDLCPLRRLSTLDHEVEEVGEPVTENPIMFNGVKIYPGCMVFKDAYDGKRFLKTLTITNCRNKMVTVKICPPTSKAFKMKPLPVGHIISPGLSIVRHIKYLYTKPTAIPQACMDVYIDNEYFCYDLIVNTCYTQVNVTPKNLDFGEVDLRLVSEVKKLTITNTGSKSAQYSTDLGRNVLQIVVDPMRGTILPGESKDITVEVFGTQEGPFTQEFWIKTEPLQRVHIQGYFIEPLLKVDYPLSDKNLFILNFPKCFVGVPQHKSVVIQNHSSTSASFCINGRIKDEKLTYKEAKDRDVNFGQFFVMPLEGRLCKDQKCILSVTFIPEEKRSGPNYYICNAVVDVKKCRSDGNLCLQQRTNYFDIQNLPAPVQLLDYISVSYVDSDSSQDLMVYNDMITIILYGEMEVPNITIKPSKICLKRLKIDETHQEVLHVVNNSKVLPLILKYNKIASIEFDPPAILLPPNETVQLIIKLRPTKMGRIFSKVNFDVIFQQNEKIFKLQTKTMEIIYTSEYTEGKKLTRKTKPHFLPGITPKNCNEVGYLVDDVRFNTSDIEIPRGTVVNRKILVFNKGNDALVALPNDRQKSLKPWRNPVPCKTIFAQLPRLVTNYDVDYDLTSKEKLLKQTKDSYYLNYIRSLPKKINEYGWFEESFADYDLMDKKKILMEHYNKSLTCPAIFKDKATLQSLFVPLTPYQMHRTNVSPKFIQLGRLAANSECSEHFTVENLNPFPVHVSIKALYTSIKVMQAEFILKPNSQQDIDFVYHSDSGGTHHIPMFIIMNFFHVFDVTVLATIVANTVQCVNKDISIVPTEKTAFLELTNPINSDVSFEIDTNFFHLESFPSRGIIPANRNMIITITFNPEVGYNPVKEIAVISESGSKELVLVNFDHKRASVCLSTETLTFNDLPLNTTVTRELIIFNKSDQLLPLNISLDAPDLFPELTIEPMKALILQKADIVVKFTVKLNEIVNFSVPIDLKFQYEYSRQILLTGNVVYPSVSFKPELIKIPKIPSGSKVHTPFRVTNNTNVENYMTFPMKDYPEFAVKTKQGQNIVSETLKLAPRERKDLLLQFKPREPVAYCLYLPYKLNGILGPPELNCPESLQSGYYLKNDNNQYKTVPTEGGMEKMRVLKILCAAKKEMLRFKSLLLDFNSFGTKVHEFHVTNVSGSVQEVTLRTSSIKCFIFTSHCDENACFCPDEDVMKTILDPETTATVRIKFNPESYGDVTEIVPIFVKDYSETESFNYLKLSGQNPEPQILSNIKVLYFTPAYSGVRQTKAISLELIAHQCSKKLEVNFMNSEIDVALAQESMDSDLKTSVEYLITFAPLKDCSIETKVIFSCPCLKSISVEIFACSDPSTLISFMSEPSIIRESTYPLFPSADDTSNYANLLRTVSSIIERWLYTQGYFYQNYYRVPDDIARFPVDMKDADKKANTLKNSKKEALLPLVQLLVNLMDSSIMRYIDDGQILKDVAFNRSFANFIIYKNSITFLKSQGIFVPGLRPEHLLTYTEYRKVCETTKTSDAMQIQNLTKDEFYRFSKQKWLDLFFHVYKVLVQQRIVDSATVNNERDNEFIKTDKKEFAKYLQENRHRFPHWFLCDAKLLLWLEYHYNRQKTVLWPSQKFEGNQHFDDFCNVDDGVALATVTAAYCPYLADQLRDIYLSPKNVEQQVHNACKVVKSWKSLKLSFDVHPQTIVTANKIKIIFIVTYLYEVLPHFYPVNQVTIESPLTDSASYNLSIQNYGNVPIQYVATFFGEKSNLFELNSHLLEIPGGKTRDLKLTYIAKGVLDASVILVLSGEAGGQRYAKSIAVTITGVPLTTSSDEIKLQVETYKYAKKKIEIKSPYAQRYVAQVFLCFDSPKSYKDLHSVASLKRNHIPREIDVIKNECEFMDKGEGTITLATCFLHQGPLHFYLYFCNDVVGDFCVLINLLSIVNKTKFTVINAEFSISNAEKQCKCKRSLNPNCPKNVTVNLPSRNEFLWKSMDVMLSKCLANSTFELIKRFSDTPIIFRFLKFYLDRFPKGFMLPSCIFDDEKEFSVNSTNKTVSFGQPKTVKIRDVTSEETTILLMHLDGSVPQEVFLELKSLDSMETRYYKVIFTNCGVKIEQNLG